MQTQASNRAARMIASAVALVLAGSFAALAQQQPAQPAAAGSTVKHDDPRVDQILTRMEQRRVSDLRAKLTWELVDAIAGPGQAERKYGQIWYKQDQPVAKFKIHFDRKAAGNVARDIEEDHLFDGRWYVVLQESAKSVTRQEIRRPDDQSNPFKLGEGAFPLPFGQSKAGILREFEVTRGEPAEGDPKERSDHLILKPRPGTRTAETYAKVEFWIASEGKLEGLPVKVKAAKKDGAGQVSSFITVSFSDPELNPGLSSSIFQIETPKGFSEEITPLARRDPK